MLSLAKARSIQHPQICTNFQFRSKQTMLTKTLTRTLVDPRPILPSSIAFQLQWTRAKMGLQPHDTHLYGVARIDNVIRGEERTALLHSWSTSPTARPGKHLLFCDRQVIKTVSIVLPYSMVPFTPIWNQIFFPLVSSGPKCKLYTMSDHRALFVHPITDKVIR